MHGVFRFTDEHCDDKKEKKSTFKVVLLDEDTEKEEVPIEVSFNKMRKLAMISVKSATGGKHQRSEVVKGKNIHDAFPITMLEYYRNWKITARVHDNQDGKRNFDLYINNKSFFALDYVPQAG